MSAASVPSGSAMKTNGNAGANKPRARLSPTEIVNLPASDSEPEDLAEDDEAFVEVEGQPKEEGDFLQDYPEETEVNKIHPGVESF